jgi:hypothetical protein
MVTLAIRAPMAFAVVLPGCAGDESEQAARPAATVTAVAIDAAVRRIGGRVIAALRCLVMS